MGDAHPIILSACPPQPLSELSSASGHSVTLTEYPKRNAATGATGIHQIRSSDPNLERRIFGKANPSLLLGVACPARTITDRRSALSPAQWGNTRRDVAGAGCLLPADVDAALVFSVVFDPWWFGWAFDEALSHL